MPNMEQEGERPKPNSAVDAVPKAAVVERKRSGAVAEAVVPATVAPPRMGDGQLIVPGAAPPPRPWAAKIKAAIAPRLGGLSLLTVTAGFAACRFGIPMGAHPMLHEAFLRFFEAGMVGGAADWFAVTALFRDPTAGRLGFEMPHTNLLWRKREVIADRVAGMVKDLITPERLRAHIDLARMAQGLLQREDAKAFLKRLVRESAGDAARQLAAQVRSHPDVEALVNGVIENVNYAEYIGPLLLDANERGQVDDVVKYGIDQLLVQLDRYADPITDWLYGQLGYWMTYIVGKEQIRAALPQFKEAVALVAADPQHPLRQRLRESVESYGVYLRGHPATQEQVRATVVHFLHDSGLADRIGDVLDFGAAAMDSDLASSESKILAALDNRIEAAKAMLDDDAARRRFNEALDEVLDKLLREPKLVETVAQVARQGILTMKEVEFRTQATEALNGDLQMIRLNGALVGGSVGLLLYLATAWLP